MREDDSTADSNGFAAQTRVKQLLDRCIEGVEVRVEDSGCCFNRDSCKAAGAPVRIIHHQSSMPSFSHDSRNSCTASLRPRYFSRSNANISWGAAVAGTLT